MGLSIGIPSNWNIPLFWAVVDGSKAGNLSVAGRALLVGQMLAAGTAAASVPVPVGSVALAAQMFGVGSQITRMAAAFFKGNTTQQLWALPVVEPSAGTAATGTIVIGGTLTNSGVLTVYIAGQVVAITVNSTDATTLVATNLAAAITALTDLPVTASAASSTVTLTAKWKGLTGNDITIIPNYGGVANGEALPAGLTATVTAMASGAGNPDFTSALANIQAIGFDYVAMPFTDSASMTSWSTEYGFGPTGRWSYTRQQYGFCVGAYRNNYASTITFGLGQNAPVLSTMAVETDSPSPMWEWTAAYCARASQAFSDDPARPLQTLEMPGILPARVQNRYSPAQLNSLVNSGMAVQDVAPSGNPQIMREQTQYQLNQYGQADTAFGLLTVLSTLAELLRRMASAITTKFPRVKLFPDGTKLSPGQAAVTPSDIKAELISEFNNAMFDGLVADLPDFVANLIVQIDNNNPNRIQVLWPPQLAGQLRQFEVLAQFRLQYSPVPI